MKYPKFKRYSLIMLSILAAAIVLGKCLPESLQADPIGPPTIEQYMAQINNHFQVIKYMGVIVSALFTLLIGALTYAYKRDIKNVNDKADDNEKDIKDIKREFLSIEGHDRGCPHRSPMVDPGH